MKLNKLIVVLGPTASGKTTLAVKIAYDFKGEIISADSRQVYKGLDIGSGKDLCEYNLNGKQITYHLIDIIDLNSEYNVFQFQKDFNVTYNRLKKNKVLPIMAGGTGLYIESVLSDYELIEVPENKELRQILKDKTINELIALLKEIKGNLHNTTDITDHSRLIRAIEIASANKNEKKIKLFKINPLIIGTKWDREELKSRISIRLKQRLKDGMIEEVESIIKKGISIERLKLLGLEYGFISDFLQGKIKNRNDLYQKLRGAIVKFSKRQNTWYKRMEKNNHVINWIDCKEYNSVKKLIVNYLSV